MVMRMVVLVLMMIVTVHVCAVCWFQEMRIFRHLCRSLSLYTPPQTLLRRREREIDIAMQQEFFSEKCLSLSRSACPVFSRSHSPDRDSSDLFCLAK